MKRSLKKGFTLIELLVVIAIISVLLGVVAITLNPLERIKEGRDSRRQQDLQNVKKAIDLALADGEITLVSLTTSRNSENNGTSLQLDASNQTSGGWVLVEAPSGKTGLIKYLPVLPADPSPVSGGSGNGYQYMSNGSCYQLGAEFETAKFTPLHTSDGGNENSVWEIGSCIGTLSF